LKIEDEFLDALADTMHEALTTQIASFISEMKQKELKNGGFPNTELMINALEEAIKFKIDNINNEIFDDISGKKALEFEEQLNQKLDLDPETLEWMADARKRAQENVKTSKIVIDLGMNK
jgi:coproporphyrinogen III oxidase-like Fe-S oxidoreductase